MVSQVPAAQGDRWGLPSISGSGIHLVQTPVESMPCPKLTQVLPPRGRGKREHRSAGTTWGNPTTTLCYRGDVQALRGQEACPRSQSKCTGTGNPSRPPPQAGSASEGLALNPGSCEVTSSGVMGHKTQSPAHAQGPRAKVAWRGQEKALQALKLPAREGWEVGGRRLMLCNLGHLRPSLSLTILFGQRV